MTAAPSSIDTSSTGFALDVNSLDALKRQARDVGGEGQKQALKAAAKQFEAMFTNMILKSMRDSLPKDGELDSDSTRTYTSMLDQQLSQKIAGKGLGLADMIVKQVSKHTVDPASVGAAQGATAAWLTPGNPVSPGSFSPEAGRRALARAWALRTSSTRKRSFALPADCIIPNRWKIKAPPPFSPAMARRPPSVRRTAIRRCTT